MLSQFDPTLVLVMVKMNLFPLPDDIKVLFIDTFLQYPFSCALGLSLIIFVLFPVQFHQADAAKGRRWLASCVFIFALSMITSVLLKPVLALASDRIIFRPTPSCSTFDNPPRYICLTFNANHQQAYYTTNWQNCNSSDPNMNNATKYYIISSWIPSFDHFVLTERVLFQPESSSDAYPLPKGYCVRAAGPTGGDRQKVAFYSISGSRQHLLDSGYINSTLLKEFTSGWYLVSSCISELSELWYNCTVGYVSSHYVRLPQYARKLLSEDRGNI